MPPGGRTRFEADAAGFRAATLIHELALPGEEPEQACEQDHGEDVDHGGVIGRAAPGLECTTG
jgi:hypothetical protein